MSTSAAAKEAARAANEAVRDLYAQRDFKIARFGRHRDGYLHAFVRIQDSEPIYVHRRSGSWFIPNEPQPGYPDYDGPALRAVIAPYTYALAEEARRFEAAERKREEIRNDAEGARSTEHGAGRSAAAEAA